MSKKKSHYSKAGLVFEELEPRLLLSADPLAVATEASVATVLDLVPGDSEDHSALVQTHVEQSISIARNELVIIDSRAPNYQQLHNDLIKAQQQGRNIHVIVLDAHRDGIDQISEALESHNNIDAVHIVSHGDDGQLQLGATQLDKTTLKHRSSDISNWKESFSDGGDMLIYGCNLAATAEGKTLVDALSYLTATDVAASDDLTGNQLLGGDWELEYEAGNIESSVAFSDNIQHSWQGTLDGAAPAGAAQEEAAAKQQQQQEQQAQTELAAQQAAINEEQQEASKLEERDELASITQEQRQEVVFIDESVSDFQSFIDDLQADSNGSTMFEIILLDASSNGIEQINDVLSDYDDVDALHIISHGDDGAVKLGNTWLNTTSLEQYTDSLTAWGSSLQQDADILIYGCNLAESEQGESFINQLANLTGADVAASDDITGHNSFGGDWVLEYSNGSIEANVAVSAGLQNSYESVLAPPIANNDNYSINQDQTLIVNALTENATASDLAAAWQFEEGSGTTTADATGNGNDGTLISGTAWTASSRTGDAALVFDGVDDYVQTAGSSLDLSTATNFTISAWFKTDTTAGQHHILWQGVSTENGWGSPSDNSPTSSEMHLTVGRYDTNDKITFFMGYDVNDANSIDITSASNFTDTSGWHHAVVVVSDLGGGTLQADLYVDGVLEGADTGTQTDRSQWDSDIRIGRGGSASRFFDGMIDEVGIYDRALTSTEAIELYQTGVIANDTDIDGDILAASLIAGPVNGAVTLTSDGSFTYTPNVGFVGTDTFTYKVNDGSLDSNTATVTIDVFDNAPVATNDPGEFNSIINSYSPLSYWRFGESSGTSAADDGGSGNNATYNGVTLGQSSAINGDSNTSVGFDGVDDFVEIGHDNSYLLDDGTVQMWFNTNDLLTDQGLFSKDSSDLDTGGHFTIMLLTNGSIEVRLQSATGDNFMYSAAGAVSAGSWHHVAVTFGSAGMELFLDGVGVDTNAYSGGLGTTSGDIGNFEPIAIGASARSSGNGTVTPLNNFFGGSIDEVAITSQVLTAEQIQILYASALQNYTVAEDSTLSVAAAEGVLINDTDAEGDALTASLVSGPTYAASFTLNADGSFDYTPLANFSGTDTFTYMANDGDSDSNVATVTITVTGDNDAPVNTVPGTQVVLEDTQTAITGISVADPDAGAGVISTQLTVTNGVLDVTLSGAVTISAGANSSSTLTISGNVTDINATLATLQYTGNSNVNGVAADTLTVVTNDLGNTGTGGAQSDTDNVQINITAVNDAPVARDDRIGLVFDGVDDYVRIGDYPGLNVSTNLTMEAWIKPTGMGTGSKIIINKEGEYEMGINASTGEVRWAFDNVNPNWNWHDTGYFVQAGEWTHLAVTYNNGVVNTFANGVLVETYNGSGAIADNYPAMNELQIGARQNAVTQRFDGQIDEVRVWNTTRTQLDIQTNMNTLLSGAEPGLIGNWRFDEGSGTAVVDQSALGHDGTLADGVTAGEMPAWQGYVVSEDGTLNVSAVNGVLPNDFDIDGDTLTAVLDTGPTNAAAFTLNPDGSFTYTPAADFYGIDSFTYHANDGSTDSNIATVTIRVDPVNDAPTATNLSAPETYTEDTALNLTDIVVSDVDSANVTVTLTLSDVAAGSLNTGTSGAVTSTFAGGVWTASGAIADVNTLLAGLTFTPTLNYNSNFSIATSVSDGVAPAITGSKAMTGTAVNDAPQATNLSAPETYTEDTALNLTDIVVSDVDSANVTVTLTLSDVTAGSLNTASSGAVTSTFGGGVWSASGAIADVNTLLAGLTFTPTLNYNSNFSIATSVNDGVAPAITGTKVMTGTAVNDTPTMIFPGTVQFVNEDTPLVFSLANGNQIAVGDIDANGGDLLINFLSFNGTLTLNGTTGLTFTTGDGVADTAMTFTGSIADINAAVDGLVFMPDADFSGGTNFQMWVDDQGNTGSGGAKQTTRAALISVTPVNDAPQATNLSAPETYTEDTALNLTDIVVSDVDSANVMVTLTLSDVTAGSLNTATSGAVTSTFGGGVWSASGAINDVNTLLAGLTFTPTLNYNSNFSIATSVDDGVAPAITGTKVMTGTAVNDVPVANTDNFTVNEGSTTVLDLAFNDVDVDDGLDLNSIIIIGAPANGSLIINGDGTVTYTHNGSETLSDSFTYTISDISGAISNTATVNITVTPVNDAPVAGDDSASVTEGNSVLIDLAANDSDVDNALDLNSINIIVAPANGSLLINGNGTVTYTHDGSNTVSDTFTYTISDVSGAISNTATVNITVTAINDAPTTSGITDVSVNEDSSATSIDLNAAFDDSDNLDSELAYSIVGNTNIGLFSTTAIDAASGQLMLDYAANMNGAAQISIRATDPSGLSVDTLFTVSVTPVNDAPVMRANTGMQTTAATPATISGNALNATDIDNISSEVIYTITTLPTNGALLLNGVAMAVNDTFTQADLENNLVAYQSAAAAVSDQFGFTVADSSGSALANDSFDIVVQVGQDSDDDNGIPPTDGTTDDDVTEEQDNTETGDGGPAEEAGGFGGGFVPIGSTSVPPSPAPVLTIDPTPAPVPQTETPPQTVEKDEPIVAEAEVHKVSTFAAVQVQSMDALWSAIDKMKQEMAESAQDKASVVEFKVAAAKSSGVVLTAGVVAWILRSGALLSSLMSTIPLWKGYDPLPILAYKDDDEKKEEEMHEDKIPTSLEELKKLKKLKEKREEKVDVDAIFGGSAIRE